MKKIFLLTIAVCCSAGLFSQTAERWGIFELTFKTEPPANPFVGVTFYAEFTQDSLIFTPEGFYDGNGIYKVRFMPCSEGIWRYATHSNIPELNDRKGEFKCTPASEGNHGPVSVRDQFHFRYADGLPFYPFGTTIYEWAFRSEERKQQTVETLKQSPFNKARMLAVPPFGENYQQGGANELKHFPYEGEPPHGWDFSRFDPVFFQDLEKSVKDLLQLGIEADLILFRPYDKGKWGFDMMTRECNEAFIRYVVARFAAFRNIWWSLCNENSFIKHLTDEDWDNLFRTVEKYDPYSHLRSIHNADRIYDYKKPWVSHVSLQFYNAVKVAGVSQLLRDQYGKPVIHDEINYEGNISRRWGQLSGEELTRRFWNVYMCGAYATHGEATDDGWISGGGRLSGTSPARIAFLRRIVEECGGLNPLDPYYNLNLAGRYGEFYILYFGDEKPKSWEFLLPDELLKDGMKFKAEIIDTWEMTVTPLKDTYRVVKLNNYQFCDEKRRSIKLPGKPYIALKLTRVGE